jgi:hypothetical protein
MFCDRIAACRTYHKDNYSDADPYDYYIRSKGHILIHAQTSDLIERWLLVLKEQGEDEACRQIREELRRSK